MVTVRTAYARNGIFEGPSMIAPRKMSKQFTDWNYRNRAPFGNPWLDIFRRFLPPELYYRFQGPFWWQNNNSTRLFEYPWAFYAAPVSPGMRILEIGGGLSGFQFALDRVGCEVINVDPGMEAEGVGWPCDQSTMAKMNRLFGSSVKLLSTTIEKVELEPDSFDRIYSISAIEHFAGSEPLDAIRAAHRYLKPGGYLVLTVDLFLNLKPFTSRETNEYGKNMDVKSLVEAVPCSLVIGNPAELYGFPEFDSQRILSNLEIYYLGYYPALAQCIVLQKPVRE